MFKHAQTIRQLLPTNYLSVFDHFADWHSKLKRGIFLKYFNFFFFFFFYYYSFSKDLPRKYLLVSKFLLKVPKFKENVLICVITITKEGDRLLTL